MFRCLGDLVPSSSTTPQLRCLAAKLRCNRTGRQKKKKKNSTLFLVFTYIRNHRVCLEDPSQNDEKEAECL